MHELLTRYGQIDVLWYDVPMPYTTAEGWGTFSQQRTPTSQTNTIEVRWGQLNVKTLAFDLPVGVVTGG